MTKQERVQNLIEGLCESIQECYDDGNYVSQDVVHQTAMELFQEDAWRLVELRHVMRGYEDMSGV